MPLHSRSRLALLTLLLTALAFFTLDQPPREAQAQAAKAEWTLMFYLDADCDLEKATIDQLHALVEEGSSKDVHIVVLCDRSALGEDDEDGYTNEDVANLKDWSGGKLLYVQKDKLVELANLGNVNCGDPALVHRLIVTAAKRYPAKKYAVIFGDHGSGWSGFCSDDSFNGDFLSINKLRSALQAATRDIGGPLEIIGFDNCLMATVETADAVAPYGRYMVASEELEPSDGWDVKALLKALKAKPTMNGAELGKVICNTYKDQFDKSDDEDQQANGWEITLSVVDLSKVAALNTAINGLVDRKAKLLRDERFQGWVKLAKARARAEEYGRNGDAEAEPTSYDLGHLAARIKQLDPASGPACDAVLKALKSAVLHSVNGKALPNATGLSICFPRRGEDLTESETNTYAQLPFARSTRWLGFLQQYITVAEAVKGAPELGKLKLSKKVVRLDKDEKTTLTSSVKGEDIDEVYFTLAVQQGKKKVVIGQVEAEVGDDGELEVEWDGGWFVIGHKDQWLVCPIVSTQPVEGKEHVVLAEVPAQVRKKGHKNWLDLTLHFYLDFSGDKVKGKFLYAFYHGKNGSRQIKLDKDDEVRPVYLEVDEKGHEHNVASDSKDNILKLRKPNGIGVDYQPVAAGTYFLGFGVTNLAGHRDDEDVEVKVK